MTQTPVTRLRQTLFKLLQDDDRTTVLEQAVGVLICVSIVLAILATEPAIRAHHLYLLQSLDLGLAICFLIEYIARLWVAPLDPSNRKGLTGALHYACSPIAILDLIAIAPTLIGLITPELYILRVIRLVRIGRLGRSNRFRRSLRHFHRALYAKRNELQISSIYTAVVLLISSSIMYIVEASAQPEAFGSIPRCLWWSIITVTTVGYGDVSPVTTVGKIVASFTAIAGIAVIAIPIGIISSGFSESFSKSGKSQNDQNDNTAS